MNCPGVWRKPDIRHQAPWSNQRFSEVGSAGLCWSCSSSGRGPDLSRGDRMAWLVGGASAAGQTPPSTFASSRVPGAPVATGRCCICAAVGLPFCCRGGVTSGREFPETQKQARLIQSTAKEQGGGRFASEEETLSRELNVESALQKWGTVVSKKWGLKRKGPKAGMPWLLLEKLKER